MTLDEIDNVVMEILIHDGPDGHIDGHKIITEFICELLAGRGDEWANSYAFRTQNLSA